MTIRVRVNGNEIELPTAVSIEQMIRLVDIPQNYLAVEVNAIVVPREDHGRHLIDDGDEVEVVTLVGGG